MAFALSVHLFVDFSRFWSLSFPFLSFPFLSFPFLSFSFCSFPFLFLSFPCLSFLYPFLFFLFLSFPFLFLSFPFLAFPFFTLSFCFLPLLKNSAARTPRENAPLKLRARGLKRKIMRQNCGQRKRKQYKHQPVLGDPKPKTSLNKKNFQKKKKKKTISKPTF